jgi:exonuclease VII large subunit
MMVTKSDKPALEIYNRRDHPESLSGSGELVALNNSLEYLAWQAGETVGFAQASLTDMTSSLQDYFKGKEWARQKDEMERSLERLGVDAQQAMAQMEKDYDALVEELEAKSEISREQIQKHYEELSANVAKQMEILLKNGEEAVAEPLRQFSEALDRLMKKYSATAPDNS